MNSKDFLDLVNASYMERTTLCSNKAHDYATEDCLSNFKRMATLCSQLKIDVSKPAGTALFLMTLKIDRICNLLSSGTSPKNESVNDTLNDLQNYIDLLRAILREQEG